VELDFKEMGPRILYGLAEAPLPEGDIYRVPGFEDWRDAIKKVFNAMFWVRGRRMTVPEEDKHLFPEDRSIRAIQNAIKANHPAIRHLFFTDVGYETMFVESNIMVDVLLTLKDARVVALPIHDAVLVPDYAADMAERVMRDVFRKHVGLEGAVTREGPVWSEERWAA
jgi:hypothetical protein